MFEVVCGTLSGIFDDEAAAKAFATAQSARHDNVLIKEISRQDWENRKSGLPTKEDVDVLCEHSKVVRRIIEIETDLRKRAQ